MYIGKSPLQNLTKLILLSNLESTHQLIKLWVDIYFIFWRDKTDEGERKTRLNFMLKAISFKFDLTKTYWTTKFAEILPHWFVIPLGL